VKIVWEQSVYVGNAPVFCAICDRRSYPVRDKRNRLLLAVIYDQRGVAWGEACRDCVAAGSAGIRTRIQDRIESYKKKIDELQTLVEAEIETPTLEQEFQFHSQDAS
jgi:hypothetical protein